MRIVLGFEQGRLSLEERATIGLQPSVNTEAKILEIFNEALSISDVVKRILTEVHQNGDEALQKYSKLIDGAEPADLEVPKQQWDDALDSLPSTLRSALSTAAERIRAFHTESMPHAWKNEDAGYGETIIPLEQVGIYIPGGTLGYPSSVLMNAIPAKVAGVNNVIVCTPKIETASLAAAKIAGVDRLFHVGGAQAIAAMGYGTETIPKVDKICGPGNAFVSMAKREIHGDVDTDGFYGPTETLLIADASANPKLCAADLLAQAEHDALASPILITTSSQLAYRVLEEIEQQLETLERRLVAESAVKQQGLIIVVNRIMEAITLANIFAPEHLCILTRQPKSLLPYIRNAGGIFLGEHSPEVMGDYIAGPSHTMPTNGTARYNSYLGVHHFLKRVPILELNQKHIRELGSKVEIFAQAEGLTGHAKAISLRLKLAKAQEGRANE